MRARLPPPLKISAQANQEDSSDASIFERWIRLAHTLGFRCTQDFASIRPLSRNHDVLCSTAREGDRDAGGYP